MALDDKHLDEVIAFSAKLLNRAITKKQRLILLELASSDFQLSSSTSVVKSVASRLGCAESTVWDALSVFKDLDIVSCKNGRIEITDVGSFCVKLLGDLDGIRNGRCR